MPTVSLAGLRPVWRAKGQLFERSARTVSLGSESGAMTATPVLVDDEDCFAAPRLIYLPRAARLRKK